MASAACSPKQEYHFPQPPRGVGQIGKSLEDLYKELGRRELKLADVSSEQGLAIARFPPVLVNVLSPSLCGDPLNMAAN